MTLSQKNSGQSRKNSSEAAKWPLSAVCLAVYLPLSTTVQSLLLTCHLSSIFSPLSINPPPFDVFLPLSTVCSPLSATAFLLALHLLVTPPFHCSLILYTFFLKNSFLLFSAFVHNCFAVVPFFLRFSSIWGNFSPS